MQRSAGLLAAVLLGWTSLALAQDTTGTLTGQIIDAQDSRFRAPFLTPGSETVFGAPNADCGRILAYEAPRQVGVGLRFEF